MKKQGILITIYLIAFMTINLLASQRDHFVYAKLKHKGGFDPYTNNWKEIHKFIKQNINLKCLDSERLLTFDNDIIFSSPFILITGKKDIGVLNETEIINLEKFIIGGGLLFINDASLIKNSSFERSIKREIKKVLPRYSWGDIHEAHAIYKSFYLVRRIGGLRRIRYNLEGIFIDNRLAIILCHNDILGVFPKDNFGNYLYDCIPGGYDQRKEGIKLLINIIMYSVTGDYKEDVIHKPFIDKKLRR